LEIQGLKYDMNGLTSTNGKNLKDYLFPGDICLLNRPGKMENMLVWVNYSSNDSIVLLQEDGNLAYDPTLTSIEPSTSIRVLHSGRRNMASISVGSVTCMINPLKQSGET